ncbi:hypothetical protein SCHPADRAFT_995335 [Schizopora paradoxa]|uniref:Uncharacterized protein n=1 Tax=Schizopora paradoxa TaxID=27342 RepID=A0A0H2RVN4_9AGAM|nr:hypothetical protein SCHPADRAFT_995335 [Schizopora paradoxa]
MEPNENDGSKTPDSRGRKVYPASLALDDKNRHVPLHRRGKSKTFERLEDLLREAGYKETRVFTPEAERLAFEAGQRAKREKERRKRVSALGSTNGLGGAVANLFTGIIRQGEQVIRGGARPSEIVGHSETGLEGEMHSSRLAIDSSDPPSPSPSPRYHQIRRPFTPNSFSSDCNSPQSSNMPSSSSSRSPPRIARRVPDARTTLRHMISAPNIPQRRQVPPPSRRTSERPHSQVEANAQPPLPSNWLQTVKQAVLGTGLESGAYVGGPVGGRGRTTRNARTPQSRRQMLRDPSGRSPSANRRVFTPHVPRAHTSPGVVTTASVVCRSAPGSRSSSASRGAKRGKENQNIFVPSLGVTTIEGDAWPTVGAVTSSDSAPVIRLDSESDDDSDDGELCFARLIIPNKRQHSIQSLRKHLHDAATPTHRPFVRPIASTTSSLRRVFKPSRSNTAEDSFDDDGLQRSWHQYGAECTDDTADEWSDSGLPGFERTVKKRAPLPWASWSTNKT